MSMTSLVYIVPMVISFAVTALLGKVMIPFLKKLHFGQTIREEGPSWHKGKQGTPTMGGVMFIIGIVVAAIVSMIMLPLLGFKETSLMMTKHISGLIMAVCFGVIGFIDDYIGIVKKRNKGLTEKQKLVLQFLVAGVYLLSVAIAGGKTEMRFPLIGTYDLGFFYYIISAVMIVGIVNAVNFTDGIDGLNSIVCIFPFVGFALIASRMSMYGMTTLGLAAAAACLGFLIWNFNPAKVFMGDTGSLFLGGMFCALAFGVDLPILVLLAALVPLIEIISVVLQVTYFKATHGKRLFKMAPIHHHFEMKGWGEIKICAVFGAVSLLATVATYCLAVFG